MAYKFSEDNPEIAGAMQALQAAMRSADTKRKGHVVITPTINFGDGHFHPWIGPSVGYRIDLNKLAFPVGK
jgi:hypothetical protein